MIYKDVEFISTQISEGIFEISLKLKELLTKN